MKLVLCNAVFSFALVVSSFASEPIELRLDSREVVAPAADLVLVRTAKTPVKVTLWVPVVYEGSDCVEREVRREFGVHSSCGEKPCQSSLPETCELSRDWASCFYFEERCVRYESSTKHETVTFKLKFKDRVKLRENETETYRFIATSPLSVMGGPIKAKTLIKLKR